MTGYIQFPGKDLGTLGDTWTIESCPAPWSFTGEGKCIGKGTPLASAMQGCDALANCAGFVVNSSTGEVEFKQQIPSQLIPTSIATSYIRKGSTNWNLVVPLTLVLVFIVFLLAVFFVAK